MPRTIAPFLVQFSRREEASSAETFAVDADGLLRRPGTPRPVLDALTAPDAGRLTTMETRATPDQPDPDVIRATRQRIARHMETKIVTFVPDPDVIRTVGQHGAHRHGVRSPR